MSIISSGKEIIDLIQKAGDMDLYRKMVDLQGELVKLAGTNVELSKKNADLEKQLALKQTMEWSGDYYWIKDDPTPFCPRCFDHDHKAIHLAHTREMRKPWACPHCKSVFTKHTTSSVSRATGQL